MEPIVLVVVPPCWKATCHHFSPWGCNKLIIRTGILDACRVCVQENGADGRVCMPQSVADWQSAPLTARARSARSTAHARPLSMHAGTGRQAGAQDGRMCTRACVPRALQLQQSLSSLQGGLQTERLQCFTVRYSKLATAWRRVDAQLLCARLAVYLTQRATTATD